MQHNLQSLDYLHKMAVAWNLYLSFSVILIFSKGAFSSQVLQQLSTVKKSFASTFQIVDQNVTSIGYTSVPPIPSLNPPVGTSSDSENFSSSRIKISSKATFSMKNQVTFNGHHSTTTPWSSLKEKKTKHSFLKPFLHKSVPTSHFENVRTTNPLTTRQFPVIFTNNRILPDQKITTSQMERSVTESTTTIFPDNVTSNDTEDVDIPLLRNKFIHALTNFTTYVDTAESLQATLPPSENSNSTSKTTIQVLNRTSHCDPSSSLFTKIKANTINEYNYRITRRSYSTVPPTVTATTITTPYYMNITPTNFAIKETHSLNKEHLQFPGITLKVSHVLIPKQKRSPYNIQNMQIELPKTEILRRSLPNIHKNSKNSNCTRFPIQVVTAADVESKEKVNLTEEHYNCEFSSKIQNTQQKEPTDSVHTYYGGYVFKYTIPKVVANVSSNVMQSSTESTRSKKTTIAEENDDYYSSYIEYADSINGTNNSSAVDDAVFPDPIIHDEKMPNMKLETYSMPIPENSLIDSDLHDHDVMDSVMYIYFGGASHGQRGAGRQIIIVGAVIALVAQFLTLASSIRRIKTHKGEQPTIILLNIETSLTLTNLIFILGVQSTSDHMLCRMTSIMLYYLHLVTLIWFLLSVVHSVQFVCQIKPWCPFFTFCIFGWMVPLLTTLLSYVFNERSFETSLYCWVSPLKGILFSFILPVIILCIICILLTVYALKRTTEPMEDADDTYSHRKLLRISAVSLPLFSVIWFTGMVALENSTSLLFSLTFLISDTVLNWLLFACWLPSEASQWKDMDEDYYDEEEDFDDEPVLIKRRFDDQPLLSELYEYGAQGQLYNLKVEPISIISGP